MLAKAWRDDDAVNERDRGQWQGSDCGHTSGLDNPEIGMKREYVGVRFPESVAKPSKGRFAENLDNFVRVAGVRS